MMINKHRPRKQLPSTFLDGFDHPGSQRVARDLVEWADANGLEFLRADNDPVLMTYFIGVSHATGFEPLLTVQQQRRDRNGVLKGDIDIPFWRMKSRAFGTPASRKPFLDRVNALLPPDRKIRESAIQNGAGHFGAIGYSLLGEPSRLVGLLKVLDWAREEVLAA